MVTTCLLSSICDFFYTLSQPCCSMPPIATPTNTTSSADHWMEMLFSHFSVFSLGNFKRIRAEMEPGISTERKPPGRPRKHSLAGHTGIVWGGRVRKLLKSDDLLLKTSRQRRQVKVPRQRERHWLSTERGSAASAGGTSKTESRAARTHRGSNQSRPVNH